MWKSRKNLAWTDDDNRRLVEAVDGGVSPSRVAVRFNRSVATVQNQARKIGKPFPGLYAVRRARDAKIEAAEAK